MRGVVFATAGWLAAAAAAALVGLLALTLLSGGITDEHNDPMSQQAAARALTRAGSGSSASLPGSGPSPSPASRPASPSPSPDKPGAVTRALSTPGGTVVARCDGPSVQLLSWTPRQGFEVEENPVRGAGLTAYLKFESDELDVPVTVDCMDGVPVSHVVMQDDD